MRVCARALTVAHVHTRRNVLLSRPLLVAHRLGTLTSSGSVVLSVSSCAMTEANPSAFTSPFGVCCTEQFAEHYDVAPMDPKRYGTLGSV